MSGATENSPEAGVKTISLFVSSPGDVLPERDAVTRVVKRINDEQRGLLAIKDIRWEGAYYGAHDTFQSQIIETDACDLVVCIFWRRLGSELPADFPKRMKNGKPFPSGTVYEVITALEAHSAKQIPDVWVYKKNQVIADPIRDPDEMERRQKQWRALEDFWRDFFVNAQGQFAAAYQTFETADLFETMFEKNLLDWLADRGLLQARPSWSLAEKGSPFRGLEAFDVEHERIMFGRERLAARAVEAVQRNLMNKSAYLLLIGESGAGKSSLARAAILPRIMRLTGEGAGRSDVWRLARLTVSASESPFGLLANALFSAEALPELAQSDYSTPAALAAVMQQAGAMAIAPITRALQRVADQFRTKENFERQTSARFVLLIDQLESFIEASPEDQAKFAALIKELVATGLVAVVATLRADRYEGYCRLSDLLDLKEAGTSLDVPMPGPAEIADIVRNPAKAAGLSYGVDAKTGEGLDDILIKATAGRDALPLLQFTLEKLYEAMVVRLKASGIGLAAAKPEDLVLQPQDYVALGGLEGAIGLVADTVYRGLDADAQAALPQLVRGLVRSADKDTISETALECAIVKGEPMVRLVQALLASRILVAGVRTLDDGKAETTIRFAHEAVIRGWRVVRERIAADENFYRIRDEVISAERRWRESGQSGDRLIPSGLPLAEAESLVQNFKEELPGELIAYVYSSRKREAAAKNRARHVQALIYVLFICIIAGLVGFINQSYIGAQWHWWTVERPYMLTQVQPYVLPAEAERALKPGASFRECAKDCPEMIVVPAGSFTMGSPKTEKGRDGNEGPQHLVTFASPFAVAKFDVTFAEWDVCVAVGGCPLVSDSGMGRGNKPVMNVTWDEAGQYVAWLSQMTGKPYRLLSEAEWEYAARAGTATAYFWGDEIGTGNANCFGCGSQWDDVQTSPVGSFKPNAFGLYDMAGDVIQWVQDCAHGDYNGAPDDGSAWITGGDCDGRLVRGGSFANSPETVRSAYRGSAASGVRYNSLGFRLTRALTP